MFRKPDDALFARIFDDGEPGDTRMEWLRDGLKDLREVPPHGLSNDRLRDRLLGSSLAPASSKTAPWWSWAWAPVAAAAIAVVILPRLRPNPTPTVILNPDSGHSSVVVPDGRSSLDGPVALNLGQPKATDPQRTETIDADQAFVDVISSSDIVSSGRPIRRLVRISTESRRSSSGAAKRESGAVRKSVTPPVAALPGAAPDGAELTAMRQEGESVQAALVTDMARDLSLKTMATLPARPTDPLVLLAPEIDAHTGAVAATEVDSPANLSIGG